MHPRPVTPAPELPWWGGVHYVSTNNNTASRHKLSPGEPVDKRAVFLTAPHHRSVVINK